MERAYKTTYEDIYKFHAKYGRVPPMERQDKYWKSLVADMSEYSKAHADPFTTDLLVAVVNELKREYKEAQGNEQ